MQATPKRRLTTRAVRRAVVGPLVMASLFGGTLLAANSASVDSAQPVDYREECLKEGCDKEEIKELWASYNSECFDEGCWAEEVLELAGGRTDGDVWAPYSNRNLGKMFDAFRDRLGKNFTPDEMRPGYTETAWTKLVAWLDGKVIEIPVAECDAEFSNCNIPMPSW